MSAIGVIPARWNSSRFPGKILEKISGKPMIEHVINRVEQSNYLKKIIIATDNHLILEFIKSLNKSHVHSVMTNPAHLSGTDRVAEVTKELDNDLIINIQGDEPLISPKLIDEIIIKLSEGLSDIVTAAICTHKYEEIKDPSIVKVIFDNKNTALYFSRYPIPYNRDNEKTSYWKHIGIYGYQNKFLQKLVIEKPSDAEKKEKLEQLRALHIGGKIHIIKTDKCSIGVDKPEDIKKVEKFIKENNSND